MEIFVSCWERSEFSSKVLVNGGGPVTQFGCFYSNWMPRDKARSSGTTARRSGPTNGGLHFMPTYTRHAVVGYFKDQQSAQQRSTIWLKLAFHGTGSILVPAMITQRTPRPAAPA